jgi:GT2 family glycosyltransferase
MTQKQSPGFPHVEVMILNYNGEKYLDECLSSLAQTRYPDFSILLIDNNSSDAGLDLVRSRFPHVKIMQHQENLGFGRAYDLAFQTSESGYFALLNNDTRVDPDWLEPLVRALLGNENLAAASAKLLFLEQPRVINHAGGGMNFMGLGFDLGMFEPDGDEYSTPRDVFFPSGAACVMRRSAYEKSGRFDPKFFMYHEDVDLGWRLRLYGYDIRCIPESKVYHAFGGTSLKSSGMSFRNNLGYRHAIRSLIKNYQPVNLAKTLPLLIALGFRSYFRDGSINLVRCVLWNIRHLPSSLKERSVIQKNRKKNDQELALFIWPHLCLPVFFPDYSMQTLNSFTRSENKDKDITLNHTDSHNLGYGWYAPDRLGSPRVDYRWSRKEATLYFWAEHDRCRIIVQALAMAQALGRCRRFFFYIQSTLVKIVTIDSDAIQYIELDYSGPAGPLELKICCEETWRPDDIYKNQDYRNLGLGVIRVCCGLAYMDKRPYTGISVIIPTHNRVHTLKKVLHALEGQTLDKNSFEVIVVDDGSTDETGSVVKGFGRSSSIQIKYLWQENKKQGAARNHGVKHAIMPVVAFIGDDTIPAPDFLEKHLRRHNHENINDKLVVIGHTRWSEDFRVTPFMEYINEYGHQFGFSIMEDINDLPFNFFYTSNISLSRKFLQDQDVVFDEDFDTYGWEDIELGYRLNNQGMRLCFESGAAAYHDHPTDVRSFCLRQFNVGRSSRSFLQKHPELKPFLGGEDLNRWLKYRMPVKFLSHLAGFLDQKHIRLPHRIYKLILHTNYCLGVHGQQDRDGLAA